jgi:hypothetical protein
MYICNLYFMLIHSSHKGYEIWFQLNYFKEKSISKLSYDRRSVGQSLLYQATICDPRPIAFPFLGNYLLTFVSFYYGAPSLTRGWVSNLLVQVLGAFPAPSLSGYLTASFETGFPFCRLLLLEVLQSDIILTHYNSSASTAASHVSNYLSHKQIFIKNLSYEFMKVINYLQYIKSDRKSPWSPYSNVILANNLFLDQDECLRFEVFTSVTMKNAIFWDVNPCDSCKNRHFGEK